MAGYVSFLYLRWHYPDQVPGQRLCLTLSRYDQLPYALSNVTTIEYDFYIHLSSFYNIKKSSFHCFYIIIWSQCQLYRAIAENNDTAIAKVKGVGKKTAQRIVLELKEKIKTLAQEELPESFKDSRASAAVNHSTQMAIAALVSLGFKRKDAENAVNQVDPAQTVEQIISVALRKHLS